MRGHPSSNGYFNTKNGAECFISYLQGKIETQLSGYAEGSGIPYRELAERVGAFLLGTADGGEVGAKNRMPTLPRNPAPRNKKLRTLAVVERPYQQVSRKTRGRHPYWAKMTKAERSAEMTRRRQVAEAKKAA